MKARLLGKFTKSPAHVAWFAAFAVLLATTSARAVVVDVPLTVGVTDTTTVIRTSANNPFFVDQVDLVGVNFHYGGGPVAPGATLLGVGFDNINLAGAAPPPGPFALYANALGPQVALAMPFTSDNTVRVQNVGAIGTDAATLNTMGSRIFYLSPPAANHPTAQMAFTNLGANRDVYVQVVGGDAGWSGDMNVAANGTSIGTWTTVADGLANNGSLFAFDTATNAAGELVLDFAGVGHFSGIGGLIISGEPSAAPTLPPLEVPLDDLLVNTVQISTAGYRPHFTYAENLAAVNFHNAGSGDPGAARVHGVGFDNVTLPTGATGPVDTATDVPLTKNKPGALLDYAISRHGTSTVGAAVSGPGAAPLNTMLSRVKPVDEPTNVNDPGGAATTFDVTFKNLGANRNVLVQLFGGDAGWSADADIFLNGSATAHTRWESVADVNSGTPSLKRFEATTDAGGNLQIVLQAVPGAGGNPHFFGIGGAIITGESATPPAGLIIDDQLTHTVQVRSAANNAPFVETEVAAGVNFYYSGGSRVSAPVTSGTVNGIALDNVDLWNADATLGVPFSVPVAANQSGVTLEVNMPHGTNPGDPSGRGLTAAAIGPDAAALNELIAGMRYMASTANGSGHSPNQLTFSNLGADRNVYVQLIGGANGWNGAPEIFVNGDPTPVGVWADNPGGEGEASIAGFYATTDSSGDLLIDMVVPSTTSPFAGLSGVIVLAQVPEPGSMVLLGLGLFGLCAAARGAGRAPRR